MQLEKTKCPILAVLVWTLGFVLAGPVSFKVSYAKVKNSAIKSAPSEREFCLINPQVKKSPETLISEVEAQEASRSELKKQIQILSAGKDLNAPVDSYNQILLWRVRPERTWVQTHCHRVGYLKAPLEASPLSSTPWTSVSTEHLRFVSIDHLFNVTPLTTSQAASQPLLSSQDKPLVKAEKKPQKRRQKFQPDSWTLISSFILGSEFANAKGMGIIDELSYLTLGVELGTSYYIHPVFSVFGKFRHISIISASSDELTEADFVGEFDDRWTYGFHLHLSSRFSLGASYSQGEWLLFKRATPIFRLEPFRERVHIGAFHFEWLFQSTSWGQWGLVGHYGSRMGSQSYSVKDYHTALVLKNDMEDGMYEFSLAYELNSYKYGTSEVPPSSIRELNRNRYLLTFRATF